MCASSASTGLCGGQRATAVPTATTVDFQAWCTERGREALPAVAETLALYLTELARDHHVSTLTRRLAAIAAAHHAAGYESPGSAAGVRTLIEPQCRPRAPAGAGACGGPGRERGRAIRGEPNNQGYRFKLSASERFWCVPKSESGLCTSSPLGIHSRRSAYHTAAIIPPNPHIEFNAGGTPSF